MKKSILFSLSICISILLHTINGSESTITMPSAQGNPIQTLSVAITNAEVITSSLLEQDEECGLGLTANNYTKEELHLLFTGLKIMHARTKVLDKLKYIILHGSNTNSAEKRALVDDLFAHRETAFIMRYAPGEFRLNKIGGLVTEDDAKVAAQHVGAYLQNNPQLTEVFIDMSDQQMTSEIFAVFANDLLLLPNEGLNKIRRFNLSNNRMDASSNNHIKRLTQKLGSPVYIDVLYN